MSKLFVDDIVEKTSGHGVSIPGHVIQVVQNSGVQTFVTTSSSWVDTPVTGVITPKFSNSLIIGNAVVAVWRTDGTSYFGVRAINSGGNTTQVLARGDGYINSASISWDTPYTFSYTAGSTSAITTTFQINATGGGNYFPNNASAYSSETNYKRWQVTLMEIAQ